MILSRTWIWGAKIVPDVGSVHTDAGWQSHDGRGVRQAVCQSRPSFVRKRHHETIAMTFDHNHVMSFQELKRILQVFLELGVRKVWQCRKFGVSAIDI